MEAGITVLADHGENRLRDPAGLVWSECPLTQGRQLVAEERVGVGQRALHGVRDRLLQDWSRILTACPAKKRLHRGHFVAGSVLFERAWNLGRTWDGRQRGLEEHDGADHLRSIQRDLQAEATAG